MSIAWKIIRIVILVQVVIVLENGNIFTMDKSNILDVFWITYIALIIAVPSYIIVIIYSVIIKLASCFEKKWKEDEKPSFGKKNAFNF